MIGSILPWAEYESSYGTISMSGLEGDGNITLILSIIVLFLLIYAIFNQESKKYNYIGLGTWILSIIIGVVALNVDYNLMELNPTWYLGGGTQSGYGLTYVEFGAIVLFFSSLIIAVTKIKRPIKREKEEERKNRNRYCPECGMGIPFDAEICPYCGRKFSNNMTMNENRKTEKFVEEISNMSNDGNTKTCSFCGTNNKPGSKFCKKCGKELSE